jgi:hypothetical protein
LQFQSLMFHTTSLQKRFEGQFHAVTECGVTGDSKNFVSVTSTIKLKYPPFISNTEKTDLSCSPWTSHMPDRVHFNCNMWGPLPNFMVCSISMIVQPEFHGLQYILLQVVTLVIEEKKLEWLIKNSCFSLKGYLGNWLHYYRVVRSKLMFYNVLTTSINNTHIKTICSSATISSQIFRSTPNSSNTLCHSCNLVGLTSYIIVTHSSESALCRLDVHHLKHVRLTCYQGNAMERPFSILVSTM